MTMTESWVHRLMPWLFLTGGSGQVYAGIKIGETLGIAQQGGGQGQGYFLAFVTIIPGVIIAGTGLFQAIANHHMKQKRLEIEARLKRVELGMPCDDKECPIQRIAREGVPKIDFLGRATRGATSEEKTVDLKA